MANEPTGLTEIEYRVLWLAGWYRERLLPLPEPTLRPDIAGRTFDRLLGAEYLERVHTRNGDAAYRITEAGVLACRDYERRQRDG